jgi:hypothetical protein
MSSSPSAEFVAVYAGAFSEDRHYGYQRRLPAAARRNQATLSPPRPDSANGPAAASWAIDQMSTGRGHVANMTRASIASGSAERLDNRRRMVVDKSSNRRIAQASITSSHHTLSRRELTLSRAGPAGRQIGSTDAR